MARFFPALERGGGGFLCIRPFLAGLLTDRRADRHILPGDDRMRARSWDGAYDRLAVLRERLAPASMTRFAIRFALAHPIVSSLIVGLNTVAQVDEVLDAAAEPADRTVFDQASGDLRRISDPSRSVRPLGMSRVTVARSRSDPVIQLRWSGCGGFEARFPTRERRVRPLLLRRNAGRRGTRLRLHLHKLTSISITVIPRPWSGSAAETDSGRLYVSPGVHRPGATDSRSLRRCGFRT